MTTPTPSAPPKFFRHKKRGTVYEVLTDARLQVEPHIHMQDDEPLVIYRGGDSKVWARSPREFYDGRFEPTAEPADWSWNRRPAPSPAVADRLSGLDWRALATRLADSYTAYAKAKPGSDEHFKHAYAVEDTIDAIRGLRDEDPAGKSQQPWQLVPREPTDEMQAAAMHAYHSYGPWAKDSDRHPQTASAYRAALAAAPAPPPAAPLDEKAERAAFEAAEIPILKVLSCSFARDSAGSYLDERTQVAWACWRVRRFEAVP